MAAMRSSLAVLHGRSRTTTKGYSSRCLCYISSRYIDALQILLFIFLLNFFMMIFSVSLSALELRANDISLLDLSFRTELADLHRRFFDRMGVNRLMFSHNSTG